VPIYEYACKKCGHRLDALQKMNDDPLVDCPECREAQLQRQLSAPRFRLKGKGWYETDFKTGDKRNIAGDADKKSDAKPDSKSKDSDKTTKKTEAKKPAVDSKAKSA